MGAAADVTVAEVLGGGTRRIGIETVKLVPYCDAHAQVSPQPFFNPVLDVAAWRRLRTQAEIRRAKQLPLPYKADNLLPYGGPPRVQRKFNPMKIPKQLALKLPFHARPKASATASAVAVVVSVACSPEPFGGDRDHWEYASRLLDCAWRGYIMYLSFALACPINSVAGTAAKPEARGPPQMAAKAASHSSKGFRVCPVGCLFMYYLNYSGVLGEGLFLSACSGGWGSFGTQIGMLGCLRLLIWLQLQAPTSRLKKLKGKKLQEEKDLQKPLVSAYDKRVAALLQRLQTIRNAREEQRREKQQEKLKAKLKKSAKVEAERQQKQQQIRKKRYVITGKVEMGMRKKLKLGGTEDG